MSDTVKSWIEERRTIHNAATEGEWHEAVAKYADDDIVYEIGTDLNEETVICRSPRSPQATEDHRAIADAHNTLPALLTAVEKVLELHTESKWGFCAQCMETGEYGWMLAVEWPCPTVQAIEGAINHE